MMDHQYFAAHVAAGILSGGLERCRSCGGVFAHERHYSERFGLPMAEPLGPDTYTCGVCGHTLVAAAEEIRCPRTSPCRRGPIRPCRRPFRRHFAARPARCAR